MKRLTIETCDELLIKYDDGEYRSPCFGCENISECSAESRKCGFYKALEKLKEYEDLEEEGEILKPTCAIGDTVYVLAICDKIPAQLDGTLYDDNGGMGTATGYYCPYEDNCPFNNGEDSDYCEKNKNRTGVFEDTVKTITFEECDMWIGVKNCMIYGRIGEHIFLTKEEAESALSNTQS